MLFLLGTFFLFLALCAGLISFRFQLLMNSISDKPAQFKWTDFRWAIALTVIGFLLMLI